MRFCILIIFSTMICWGVGYPEGKNTECPSLPIVSYFSYANHDIYAYDIAGKNDGEPSSNSVAQGMNMSGSGQVYSAMEKFRWSVILGGGEWLQAGFGGQIVSFPFGRIVLEGRIGAGGSSTYTTAKMSLPISYQVNLGSDIPLGLNELKIYSGFGPYLGLVYPLSLDFGFEGHLGLEAYGFFFEANYFIKAFSLATFSGSNPGSASLRYLIGYRF